MIAIIEIIRNVLEMGFIYALIVLAVHLSSNIVKFDDLSIEGSFAFGGALAAVLVKHGVLSWIALFVALCFGGLVGVVTGLLHTKLRLNNLISGIVVTTALFSVNLKMAGANVTLAQEATVLDGIDILLLQPWSHLIILFTVSCLLVMAIDWFLKTEIGFLLKATGNNPHMLAMLGKSVSWYIIVGLSISNSLTALAGALFVLHVGFFSISGSVGSLAVALAGLIIGQVLCKNPFIGVVVGAIGYQAIIALSIEMQLDPVWNKLITAALIVFLVTMRNQKMVLTIKG